MQTIRLPAIETEDSLWEFIEILFEELRCECFYEKCNNVNHPNGAQIVSNGKHSQYSIPSPTNILTNLENEPLIAKNKRRISETGSESTSEESYESIPPPAKKQHRPLMTTLLFNAATASSNDKNKRHSIQNHEHEEIQRKPKLKKSKSSINEHSKPRGRPPGIKTKERDNGSGDFKYKSPKHKSKPHLDSKYSNPTSNHSTERQTQPVSPSKRLPIYHNAHKMFQEHQLQKQHGLVVAAQHQINGSNVSNVNLPPPTLLPEVPTPNATITSSQTQQKFTSSRNSQISPTSNYNSTNMNHLVLQQNATKFIDKPMPVPELPSNPTDWTVDQVVKHLSYLDPSLAPHVEMFRTHEIDGKALLLLKEEMMMKYMDMKLGPALKINNIVNLIQGKKHQPLPK